jgi:uncharacterized protein (DUF58 family)
MKPSTPPTFREKLRGWMRPPRRLKITPAGRAYLVVTLGVGVGALNTGNNLLYLALGLLLSLVVVSGVLSERVMQGLRVRRLGTAGAYAGEPFAWRWALSREGGWAFALTLREVGGGIQAEGNVVALPPGEETVVRGEASAARRGPVQLTAVEISTPWPFGLFIKSRELDLQDELLVYPRRVAPGAVQDPGAPGATGDGGRARRGDGAGDLAELRELQAGEDARRVHWLKSATAGKWVRALREHEERRSYRLRVPALEGEPLDRACEQLAARAARLLELGHEVGLESDAGILRPAGGEAQGRRILRALALAGHRREGLSP